MFADTDENRLYRNFLVQWKGRYEVEEISGKIEKKSEKEAKIFDFKSKKFVSSK